MVTDRDRSVVRWVAVIGADVMARFGLGRTVGYRRLGALVDRGLLSRQRFVHGQPALYTATRDGLAWAGIPQLEPARVGVATTRHWATCAQLAVHLERTVSVEVWGEPRLRAAELEAGRAVASAQLGHLPDGRPRLRRPDLVLFPDAALPVAVEEEPSVNGYRRLEAICRAWARCRIVSKVTPTPPRWCVPFPRCLLRPRPGRRPNPSASEALNEPLMSGSPVHTGAVDTSFTAVGLECASLVVAMGKRPAPEAHRAPPPPAASLGPWHA